MAQIMFGKGYLVSATDVNLAFGYVSPLVPAPEIVDQEDEIKMLKDVLGIVEGVIAPNDCILKATFNFVPRGSTKANALLSAGLPDLGGYLVTGLPIIKVRKFADGFNCAGTNTQPWFYFGGGSLKGGEDGKEWTGTISMMRFYNITSASAIA